MKHPIETLPISNVSFAYSPSGTPQIHFMIEDQRFFLRTISKYTNNREVFSPFDVRHLVTKNEGKRCYLCGNVLGTDDFRVFCHRFHDQVDALFYHLIEFPSIRLQWLYIPYE